MKHALVCLILLFFAPLSTFSQSSSHLHKDHQFLSYKRIPTWGGVSSNWKKEELMVHVYDYSKHGGHASFVSRGLKTGITFKQFKEKVRNPKSREYMPFFLFDLRDKPITRGDKTYNWVIRIEDYRYLDEAAGMTNAVMRLMTALEKKLQSGNIGFENGIVILSQKESAQPSHKIKNKLEENGFQTIFLRELLDFVGSPKVEILNKVDAVGRLRFVSEEEMEQTFFHPTDIVVFEKMPKRVPPVSGIITLEPQTPLSHVNLLAINRGTLNLYALSLDDIPGLKEKMGKLVKIKVKDSKLTFSILSQSAADKYWKAHPAPHIDILAPNRETKNIIDLGAKIEAELSTSVIGAKAANYSKIQVAFPKYVRPGFALPFSWYLETVETPKFKAQLDSLLTSGGEMTPELLEAYLGRIRKTILESKVSDDKLTELRNLIDEHFPYSRIRLRSSTNCEDLANFNGAGLYLSKGFNTIDSDAVLEKKLLRVFASMWTLHAFAERAFYSIDHQKAAMAILIHQAFPNEYANGVAIAIPTSSDLNIVINSQPGDHLVTNPENGEIPESLIYKSVQSDSYEVQSKSNIGDVFLRESNAALLAELKAAIIEIHKLIKPEGAESALHGIDIEFKILMECNELKLYIKQARLLRHTLPTD